MVEVQELQLAPRRRERLAERREVGERRGRHQVEPRVEIVARQIEAEERGALEEQLGDRLDALAAHAVVPQVEPEERRVRAQRLGDGNRAVISERAVLEVGKCDKGVEVEDVRERAGSVPADGNAAERERRERRALLRRVEEQGSQRLHRRNCRVARESGLVGAQKRVGLGDLLEPCGRARWRHLRAR